MENVSVSWEDDANNRVVDITVGYSIAGDQIEIKKVTPQTVRFIESGTGKIVRQLGVWTDAGRRHLMEKFQAVVSQDELVARVEQKLLAAAN